MIKFVFLASVLAFSVSSHARDFSFTVGAHTWLAAPEGGISADINSSLVSSGSFGRFDIQVDNFDIADETFDEKTHNIFFAHFEHPLAYLPNVRVAYANLENTGSNAFIELPNIPANVAPFVKEGILNTSHTDFTLYYKPFDNIIEWDIGLTGRFFSGEFTLNGVIDRNATTPGSGVRSAVPFDTETLLIYTRLQAHLPFGFTLSGEANLGAFDGESATDLTAQASYDIFAGINAAVGYRYFDVELKPKENELFENITYEIQYKGPYVSLFYTF